MSQNYELTGKVKLVQDAQTFGSGFTKREVVVIVEDGKYTQEINVEFVQDKVQLLDNVRAGDDLTISFNLRGREYNERWFNAIQGWKLVTNSASQEQPHEDKPAGYDDEEKIPF